MDTITRNLKDVLLDPIGNQVVSAVQAISLHLRHHVAN